MKGRIRVHFSKMLARHERLTARTLSLQCMNPGSPECGAFVEPDLNVDTRTCAFHLAHLAEAYLIPESRYYHQPEIRQALERGFCWLLSHRRPEGCLDLTSCNFDSAPDTAFSVNEVIRAWWLLEKDGPDQSPWLALLMRQLIEGCCEGVMKGGFHTPNHRWAIAACLKHATHICSRPDFSERADVYLGEGLDIDREGEFAERSGGIYNLVNDEQMIRLYLATGDRLYLEAARSNLLMMLNYFDPDGSVFTQNSTRQDQGKKVYPEGYFGLFLLVGWLLQDENLAAYSEFCWEASVSRGRVPSFLAWFVLYPELETYGTRVAWQDEKITRVRRLFPASRIGRCRRGEWSCTVMAGKPDFLYFQHGDNTVSLTVYQNVCAQRNFIPDVIEETPQGFRLTAKAESWYYLPFQQGQTETSDWWAMDNAHKREKQIRDVLTTSVDVIIRENGVDLILKNEGLSHVPVRLEWRFSADCILRSEHFMIQGVPGGCMTVCDGHIQAEKGENSVISLGPAFARHNVQNRMGGAFPLSREQFTVFWTDYSPCERRITLGSTPLF